MLCKNSLLDCKSMNIKLFSFFRRCGLLIFLLSTASLPVCAGNIFFGLSLTGNRLTLSNQGNSTAFYPTVLRLLPDGRWQALPQATGIAPQAELLPHSSLEFIFPPASQQQASFLLEPFHPVMVRFFDQAGSSFGQLSFFNQPTMSEPLAQTGYQHGWMNITPPVAANGNAVPASWLLWPQEEGIATLTTALDFTHKQPPARRIVWAQEAGNLRLNFGAGLPSAMLLHETANGVHLQNIGNGDTQGKQQRAAWLNAYGFFYYLAAGMFALVILLMLRHLFCAWRKRSA